MNLNDVIENEYEYEIYFKKINEIKEYLNVFGPSSFWDIEKNVGASERRIVRLLREMEKDGIIKYDKNTNCFYIEGVEKAKHEKYFCDKCGGKRVKIDNIDEIIKELQVVWDNKPLPALLFDQRPVTMKTSINRVAYLLSKNDVYNKKVVFLGDDDLTSICLAMIYKEADITVLDVDERLINYIKEISKKYNLNIKTRIYNVIDGVDKDLIGKYDTLMTDPTPEKIPFIIFTNSAIDLLKENGVLYTSIYSTAMIESIDLQKAITEMNLYITEVIPNFTEYQAIHSLYRNSDKKLFERYGVKLDENSICFTETLFRLVKNKETQKLKIEYNLSNIMGKATKRVIEDNSKEVANKSSYLEEMRRKMKKNKNKRMVNGK